MAGHDAATAVAGAAQLLRLSEDPNCTPAQFREVSRRLGASAADLRSMCDGLGRSLLHRASQQGSLALVEHLLDKLGFDVNVQDERGETPLALAAAVGRVDVVRLLIHSGADVNRRREPNGTAPVHRAAVVESGSTEVLQLLLEKGAQAEMPSETGNPLCWAAGAGKEEAVRLLLAFGADPNVSSSADVTALCLAAASGSVGAVQALLDAGAAHSIPSRGGAMPLHAAAAVGTSPAVIKALLEAGAHTGAKDSDGHTPIHVAAIAGRKEVVELLLPHTDPASCPDVASWSVDGLMATVAAAASKAASEKRKCVPHGLEISIPAAEEPDKDQAASYKRQGDEAFVSGHYQQAVEAYTAALKHETSSAVIWANRAAAYLRMECSAEALIDARRSRALDPKYAKAWYREGAALGQLHQWEEAANCYFEAMDLSPGNKEMEAAFQHAIAEARKQYQAAQQQQRANTKELQASITSTD